MASSFEKELRSRERKLRNWLAQNGYDAAVFLKEEIEAVSGDYLYYGGGMTSGEYAAIIIDSAGAKTAIVHEYSFERVKSSGAFSKVYEIRQSIAELFSVLQRSVITPEYGNRVAVDSSTISASSVSYLKQRNLNAGDLLKEFVFSQRSIKSEYELKEMESAIAIAKRAFEKTLGGLRQGITIEEITKKLHESMIEEGASSSSFEIDIRLRRGLDESENDQISKLERGDLVLFDFGARLSSGYLSDVGRTIPFGVGRRAKTRDFMERVIEIKRDGLKQIRAGYTGSEVRRRIDRVIAEHGLESTHRPGHQIGLNVHEPYGPHLNFGSENERKLRKGNVVTWEPGIGLPGSGIKGLAKNRFGMAHMEDMVFVGSSGPKVLGSFDLRYW